MEQERLRPQEQFEGGALVEGVVFAALLSIPLWAAVALAAIGLLQEGPFTALQSAGFMLALAAEAILLRYVWRRTGLKARIAAVLARRAFPTDRRQMLRRAAFLAALVATYLHYYYWDVQLQIAQLNHVTVFI